MTELFVKQPAGFDQLVHEGRRAVGRLARRRPAQHDVGKLAEGGRGFRIGKRFQDGLSEMRGAVQSFIFRNEADEFEFDPVAEVMPGDFADAAEKCRGFFQVGSAVRQDAEVVTGIFGKEQLDRGISIGQ